MSQKESPADLAPAGHFCEWKRLSHPGFPFSKEGPVAFARPAAIKLIDLYRTEDEVTSNEWRNSGENAAHIQSKRFDMESYRSCGRVRVDDGFRRLSRRGGLLRQP